MRRKHISWPTAFGVKDAKGEWLEIFVDSRRAYQCWAAHPEATQLISELDPLYGICDEYPGVVVEERK